MIDQKIFDKTRDFHGVKGIVFINEKMLVYRRDTKTDYFPLFIDLPGGERENDESPFETFKREVKEEFGLEINEGDIVYAKKYMSVIEDSKESYFIVVKPVNIKESDIIFGDEGLEFFLMEPKEYLNLDDALKRHQAKVTEYIDSTVSIDK